MRDLYPRLGESRHRPLGHQVVEGDHRGHATGQHRSRRLDAVVIGGSEALDQTHLEAEVLGGPDDRPPPFPFSGIDQDPGNAGDVAGAAVFRDGAAARTRAGAGRRLDPAPIG